jgi:predicted DNA-binding transcriptional regulator YafY
MKQFRTFGLDRIEELTIHPSTFHRDPSVDLNAKFNDAIGVVYKDGLKEEVILSFDAEQANYIKSLPLHHSQEILLEDENELRIRLFVVINYELIQQILMHNAYCKVIAPSKLAEDVKWRLKQALEKYV